MPPAVPFLLERWFARYEHAVERQLSASDCEPLTARDVLAAAGADAAELLDLRLAYTQSQGDPELRAAIAAHYPDRSADDVLVVNAPQEAILLAIETACAPGDRVIVQTPCYQSLAEVAAARGCRVAPWSARTDGEGAFGSDELAFDREDLRELLRTPAALLVTNFPHNPTGRSCSPSEWHELAALVARSGVRWFSDEMYRGLAPDDARELPPAASLVPGAVSLWGLSKSFGLPGLRLGWLCSGDRAFLAAVEQRKDWTSICANALSERVARHALRVAPRLLAQNRATIAANAARMAAFAARHTDVLRWQRPQAGPVSLARVLRGTATELADQVRERGSALLVPSGLFGLEDRWVRIGLGRADFAEALQRFDRALGAAG